LGAAGEDQFVAFRNNLFPDRFPPCSRLRLGFSRYHIGIHPDRPFPSLRVIESSEGFSTMFTTSPSGCSSPRFIPDPDFVDIINPAAIRGDQLNANIVTPAALVNFPTLTPQLKH